MISVPLHRDREFSRGYNQAPDIQRTEPQTQIRERPNICEKPEHRGPEPSGQAKEEPKCEGAYGYKNLKGLLGNPFY